MRLIALAGLPATVVTALVTGAVAFGASPPENPVDPGIADGSKQQRLDSAKRSWRAAHLSSYRYWITQQCFCVPGKSRQVVVRDGRPTRYPSGLNDVATVPRLFRTIQRAIDERATRLTVTYGKRGVPKKIYIDRKAYLADEESGYTITRFTRGSTASR